MCFWESWHFWERVAAPSKRSLTQISISKIFRPKLGYFGTCISYSIPIRLLILQFFYLFIFNSRLYLLWLRTASKSPSKNGKIVLGKRTCGIPYFGWMDLFCLLRKLVVLLAFLWVCVCVHPVWTTCSCYLLQIYVSLLCKYFLCIWFPWPVTPLQNGCHDSLIASATAGLPEVCVFIFSHFHFCVSTINTLLEKPNKQW